MLVNNFGNVKEQINNNILAACEEIGKTGTGAVQTTSPVKTGNLRRSYGYKVQSSGKTFVVVIGTNIDYAIFVEMKPESRGGRPHLRKAVESEINEFNNILVKHLRKVGA